MGDNQWTLGKLCGDVAVAFRNYLESWEADDVQSDGKLVLVSSMALDLCKYLLSLEKDLERGKEKKDADEGVRKSTEEFIKGLREAVDYVLKREQVETVAEERDD